MVCKLACQHALAADSTRVLQYSWHRNAAQPKLLLALPAHRRSAAQQHMRSTWSTAGRVSICVALHSRVHPELEFRLSAQGQLPGPQPSATPSALLRSKPMVSLRTIRRGRVICLAGAGCRQHQVDRIRARSRLGNRHTCLRGLSLWRSMQGWHWALLSPLSLAHSQLVPARPWQVAAWPQR
jgi:hypothetical protein